MNYPVIEMDNGYYLTASKFHPETASRMVRVFNNIVMIGTHKFTLDDFFSVNVVKNKVAEKPPLVLHHDDADGYWSAYAVWVAFGKNIVSKKVQYGNPVPWDLIEEHKEAPLFIVDFSYKREDMLKIKSINPNVLVFDHHETAEEELKHLNFCIFNMEISATEMCWKFFNPDVPMPTLAREAGNRDMWRFTPGLTKRVLLGFEHLGGGDAAYSFEFMDKMRSDVLQCMEVGGILETNMDGVVDSAVQKLKIVLVDGKRVAFGNTVTLISEIGSSAVRKLDVDYSASYFTTSQGDVVFSFRSIDEKEDVGRIAKKLGGGGRHNTAGAKLGFDKGMALVKSLYTEPETHLISFMP